MIVFNLSKSCIVQCLLESLFDQSGARIKIIASTNRWRPLPGFPRLFSLKVNESLFLLNVVYDCLQDNFLIV